MGRATGRNNPDLGALQLVKGLLGTLGSAGRGVASATLGMPGDLESLVRMLPGIPEKTWMPTTEEVSNRLPQLSPDYRQPTIEKPAQFMPLMPSSVAKLGGVGKGALTALANRALAPPLPIAQAGAIKPRGGNWIYGREIHSPLLDYTSRTEDSIREAYNNWILGPFTKGYLRDVATENDPLVKAMDAGRMIAPSRYNNANLAKQVRAGLGGRQVATTPQGRRLEDMIDTAHSAQTAGDLADVPYNVLHRPWLKNLNPNELIYRLEPYSLEDTGYKKVHEAVKRGLTDTTLPPQLSLTPEDLKQMSLEKAVNYMADVSEHEAYMEKLNRQVEAKKAINGAIFSDPKAQLEWVGDPGLYWIQHPQDPKFTTDLSCRGGWCTKELGHAKRYLSNGKLFTLVDSEMTPHAHTHVEYGPQGHPFEIHEMKPVENNWASARADEYSKRDPAYQSIIQDQMRKFINQMNPVFANDLHNADMLTRDDYFGSAFTAKAAENYPELPLPKWATQDDYSKWEESYLAAERARAIDQRDAATFRRIEERRQNPHDPDFDDVHNDFNPFEE